MTILYRYNILYIINIPYPYKLGVNKLDIPYFVSGLVMYVP